jgi:sugar/nucleoside kinase (ribokinase family)
MLSFDSRTRERVTGFAYIQTGREGENQSLIENGAMVAVKASRKQADAGLR